MVGSCIRVDSVMVNSSGGSNINQVRIHAKHADSGPKQLSIAGSKIPSTNIPTSATIGSTIG
ncbi:hypothetical protein CR513_49138, partial [Mucuna pruriens]